MQAAPRPEVSILIVSYNTRELTLAAIQSAWEETHVGKEIIVVDNASTDGSAAAIAAHPAGVRLIALDENVGFGQANNVAASHARGEYLLLLNPDTVVLPRSIDLLVAFARSEPDAGIWGGRTLFADMTLNPSSCWGRMTLWSLVCRVSGLTALFPASPLFNSEALGCWRRDTERPVDIVSGCFLLITAELWKSLRGFDPTFFMYGEEADLCLRARALGAQPMSTPAATIVHYGGASEATQAGKVVKLLAAKISLVRRHFPRLQRPFARLLLILWPLTRWIGSAVGARITDNAALANNAAAWREVWKRRHEWKRGYPDRRGGGARVALRGPGLQQQEVRA
ncbi:MAG: glycosyltransferase family 2 protein [Hyphomicrobiaceae bacterium]|nr:glycosyltransferase family 2 protein [Hyphomicrobiaceae bacterium]